MSNTITPTVFYRTLNVEGPEIFYREAGFDDRTIVIDNAPAGINLSDVHCQPRAANLRCNRADNRNLDRRPAQRHGTARDRSEL